MGVYSFMLLDSVVDEVVIRTENDAVIAILDDVFVRVIEIITDEKAHSPIIATDMCYY